MIKRTQTIHRQQPTNCLSIFDHFVGLVLKGLSAICDSFIEIDDKERENLSLSQQINFYYSKINDG